MFSNVCDRVDNFRANQFNGEITSNTSQQKVQSFEDSNHRLRVEREDCREVSLNMCSNDSLHVPIQKSEKNL